MSAAWGGALRRALARAADHAPVRVFALVGLDAPGRVDDLRLGDAVELLDTPRSANVLLVAGRLPGGLVEPARRVHDQLSHPRASVWWTRDPSAGGAPPFPAATVVGPSHDLLHVLQQAQRALLAGWPSEAALLPDVDPAPWRGVGPYGQGGTGMTGGVPYGRPLADRADDRDGLMLDQLPVRVGPFFPAFPTGLVLDVALQGDVVQEVSIGPNPFAGVADGADQARAPTAGPAPTGRDGGAGDGGLFRMALTHRVPLAALEVARARHHLRWLAHALRVHGLEALGRRALAIATRLSGEAPAEPAALAGREVAALARLLERTHALGWATAGVGVVSRERVAGAGLGPVARAAGLAEDARLDDPAYQALGFAPALAPAADGDARARWRQRLAEAVQSLDLAARSGVQLVGGRGVVEAPRGRLTAGATPAAALLPLVPALLRDQEWGDAVTTVVSLDLDMIEAAAGAADPGPAESREPREPNADEPVGPGRHSQVAGIGDGAHQPDGLGPHQGMQ